jgi:regulator of protease activity HflC (stomatin/prohibitin superfamily)
MNTTISEFTRGSTRIYWYAGALAIIVIIVAFLSFYTIGPGKRGVLMNWGAVEPGVIRPGLHFKVPFQQSVVTLNARVQNFSSQETAASRDLQNVTTNIAINFHLVANKVDHLYQRVGKIPDLEAKVLTPIASNSVKAITARYNAENLVENRDKVRRGIEREIVANLKLYNVKIDAVNISNFAFSGDYAQAIEQKQVAQQRALQSRYELKQAKIDAQQQVVKAQAKAKATLVAAHAEAKALRLKRKAVTPELILLNAVNKWDGRMPSVLAGSKALPLLDVKGFQRPAVAEAPAKTANR